ncbi:peptidoglycan editing factor PgeF [Sandaracinomonas limnophila]|uniref:Purine nucleoside phosphorylase n=1 Tax=Sandaracinomonas limnophila TaxID=1862386 RepID=A0A437PR72_9BACT|nr:peptidoglycan editing factor PgeF [Sandaracinomonas limnophila]RVU24762.1 peptidoglycan editing factor PgeF [Sandaracinomonas limnophila]
MMHKTHQRFIVPKIFQDLPNLVAGVSTRHGGVSQGAYNSLNLGKHTTDYTDHIEQNLFLLCQDLGIQTSQLARAYQCHGAEIWHTEIGGYQENFDAIIATQPGIIAGVGIADCCPILIVDPNQKVTAAIHAGWKGTVAQIVKKTATELVEKYESKAKDLLAYIGPCISQTHFEVGDEVAAHFSDSEKTKLGPKFHVDLKKANLHQLQEAGIDQIEISEYCTIEHNEHFFSHRKENGITGRMMAFAGFKW